MLGRYGVELSRKNDKAGENVVEKVEMIGYYQLSALERTRAFFILVKGSSLEKQKLERIAEDQSDYSKK